MSDAIEHTYLSQKLKESGSINRQARAAIVNCAVALECAANISLFSLNLSSKWKDRFEKTTILEKFETAEFLRRGDGVFDAGVPTAQRMKELIKLRNDFVHPKTTTHAATSSVDLDGNRVSTVVEVGTFEYLKFNHSYRVWDGDCALSTVRAVVGFLDQCFLEWCGLTPTETTALLCSAIQFEGQVAKKPFAVAGELGLIQKATELWGVQFRCIDSSAINEVEPEQC